MVEKKDIEKALKKVIDPETGISLPDMGLIKEVKVSGGKAEIKMTLTTPYCPMAHYLVEQVKASAEKVKGIKEAKVDLVF